jgi:hypothetical protein
MRNFVPRGWKKNTNEQLQKIYQEICDKVIDLKLLNYTPDLYIFKSTRTWGWARYPGTHNVGERPFVGLNEVYLQDPTKAVSTICHELAHIASPRKSGHNQTWKNNFANVSRILSIYIFPFYNHITRG